MCFDRDSHPPIPPLAGAAVDGARIELTAADGNRFAAFCAGAATPTGAGMLVLPDVRGLHGYYEELTLRLAEAGIDAIAIDYFGRTAGTGGRDAAFDHAPHVAATTFGTLLSDVTAAAAHLRETRDVRALFSIGFCFGGRLSFLLATVPGLEMRGVIGFYGWPVGPARNDVPAPADLAREFRAAVLGVFGGADHGIPGEAVGEFEGALHTAGVEHRIVTYPGAPHSFFDRKQAEFADASAAAWKEVRDFVRARTPA